MRAKSTCSVENCNLPYYAKGFCALHYKRDRYGKRALDRPVKRPKEAPEFFKTKVLDFSEDVCLPWPFAKSKAGYGQLWYAGKVWYVHILIAHTLFGEPPTPKHEVAHSCGKGHLGCVNPKHLRWATHVENMADCIQHNTLNKKLNAEQVLEIRQLKGKYRHVDIGKMYGVSKSTITAIMAHRNWRLLKAP